MGKVGGDGGRSERDDSVGQELQRWREHVLSSVMWTGCIAMGIALFVYFALGGGRAGRMLEPFFAVLLVTTALHKRLAYAARVAVLLALLCGISVMGMARAGFGPNIPVLFETMVVFAVLLLGAAWGLAMTGVSTGLLVSMWILHHRGAIASLAIPSLFTSLVPDDPRGLARMALNYLVLSAVTVVAVSYLLDRAQGSLAEKSRALEALRRQQAEAEGLRDELRRQDEAFSKARELEALGRLAGSVAHDFNNALLIIQGNADLARHDPALLSSALDDIDAAVQQAASTTRQLRGLWHHAAATPVRIELRETVARTAQLLKRLLPSNIAVKTSGESQFFVFADEGRLQGLLTNLALNARDAMVDGGVLELRVADASERQAAEVGLSGRFAVVEVQDNGCGMSPETQARLFEPYFTTKGKEGTGLGLASAKKVAEEHGGRIVVSSELGRGTKLRIFWPLAEDVEGADQSLFRLEAKRLC